MAEAVVNLSAAYWQQYVPSRDRRLEIWTVKVQYILLV